MSYLIKALLITSVHEFYKNVHNRQEVIAKNITFTNITPGPVYVYLSIRAKDESFEQGCILYNFKIDANQKHEVLHERVLQVDDVIEAYSSHSFEAAMSIDIIGETEDGRYVDLPKSAPLPRYPPPPRPPDRPDNTLPETPTTKPIT